MHDEALRVLAWPYPRESDLNPYARLMYSAFTAPRVLVEPYAPLRRVLLPVDVFHIQWPEAIFEGKLGRLPGGAALKAAAVISACRKIRRSGGAVILTAHNINPHAALSPRQRSLWEGFFSELLQETDLLISLSKTAKEAFVQSYPLTASTPWAVVPHPHYRTVYATSSTSPQNRSDRTDDNLIIGMLGSIRPSKRVSEAIAIFKAVAKPNLSLLVAGNADAEQRAKIEASAEGHESISLNFGTLSDEQLRQAHDSVDLILLNQEGTLNSGSILTALSFGKPVIAPDVGSLREIQDYVGPAWMALFRPPLTAEKLSHILHSGFASGSDDLNLDAFDPGVLSGMLLRVFAQASVRAKYNGKDTGF